HAGFGVRRSLRLKAFLGELEFEQAPHFRLVFDDQDRWFFSFHVSRMLDALFEWAVAPSSEPIMTQRPEGIRESGRRARHRVRAESSRDDRPQSWRRWQGRAPRRLAST